MKSKIFTCLLAANMLANFVTAQAGTLDPSFTSSGVDVIVGNSFSTSIGRAILTAPDSKILTVGQALAGGKGLLARHLSDGTLDSLSDVNYWGFNYVDGALIYGGFISLNISKPIELNSIALQPDGKMVIGGKCVYGPSLNNRYILMRQNADGSYDTTFGMDGIDIDRIGYTIGPTAGLYDEVAHTVGIQDDGKILVGNEFYISRHLSDGLIDTTFGSYGRMGFSTGVYYSTTMLIQPDGKILVAGGPDFAIQRYNPDETIDTGFGTDGTAVIDPTTQSDAVYSMELLPNGDLLAVGIGGKKLAVARLKNGHLDTSYGVDGVAIVELPNEYIWARASAIQPDGKLVVAGHAGIEFIVRDDHFFMARLTEDGQLDNSFGDNGMVLTDPSGGSDRLYGVDIQQDGKIVVTGHTGRENNKLRLDYFVARYLSGLEVAAHESLLPNGHLVISPNPADTYLNCHLQNQAFGQHSILRILNAQGVLMSTIKPNNLQTHLGIPLVDYPQGMYFLQYLEYGEVRAVERFVVVH
ncbi:MAG: T9SS type A sorting domain-containing protein [Saprospiraceae bacterium]|nr:T9SS type A sorting domain-containing protein [Saprospiraceae bacterium]